MKSTLARCARARLRCFMERGLQPVAHGVFVRTMIVPDVRQPRGVPRPAPCGGEADQSADGGGGPCRSIEQRA